MPWDEIVNPEFISKSQTIGKNKKNVHFVTMTEKSSALDFPVEESPSSCLSGGPHVFHEANSFATTLMEEPADQACGSPELGKACESDGEGEEAGLAGASLSTSGCPKGSSAQPSTFCWLEAKDIQQHSWNNSRRWGNCAGSALASVPSGQLRTSDMPATNVACSVNNETECDKLFPKHPGNPENRPASLSPTVSSIIKEPHFAKTLLTHPEQELDWRYATCSYKDGEEAEGQALGTGSSSIAGGRSEFPKPSASCPDVLGVERIGDVVLTEREISGCEWDSDSSRERLEGKATSPTIIKPSQVGIFSRRRIADNHSSQKQLVEVKGQSSEWLEQRHLLEHTEGTLMDPLMELGNRISMEGNHQWQTKQSPPKNGWQLNSGDPFIPKSSLSQKAGQENVDSCQQRAGDNLPLLSSEAEPKSARTKLKENGSRPLAGVSGQAEAPRSNLPQGGAAARSVDQPDLSSTPQALQIGVSKKVGRGQGSQAPSPDKESGTGAFLEGGHNSIHEAPCQFQPSDPEMNSLASPLPALFPAVTLPERTKPIPEGDQATGTMHSATFCPSLGKWSRDRSSVQDRASFKNMRTAGEGIQV